MEIARAPRTPDAQSSSEPRLSNQRVLIVNDDADVAYILKRELGRRGHQCTIALTEEEVKIAVADHVPDVVLLDWGFHRPEISLRLHAELFQPNGIDTVFVSCGPYVALETAGMHVLDLFNKGEVETVVEVKSARTPFRGGSDISLLTCDFAPRPN